MISFLVQHSQKSEHTNINDSASSDEILDQISETNTELDDQIREAEFKLNQLRAMRQEGNKSKALEIAQSIKEDKQQKDLYSLRRSPFWQKQAIGRSSLRVDFMDTSNI